MYGRRTLPSPFENGKVTVIYRVTDIYIYMSQLCRKYIRQLIYIVTAISTGPLYTGLTVF